MGVALEMQESASRVLVRRKRSQVVYTEAFPSADAVDNNLQVGLC
jgi:hypothetical protein